MQIEMMKLGDIKPYKGNPRVNENAIDAVANSIKEFGFRQPIVVDTKKVIIIGHTRYLAAEKLSMKEIPAHIAKMSAKKARAYRLVDNKTGELADWDFGLLESELESLKDDFDFEDFGFPNKELLNLESPEDFPEVDENISTEYECPKCGYEWSGNSK